jgi:hypothetical protein
MRGLYWACLVGSGLASAIACSAANGTLPGQPSAGGSSTSGGASALDGSAGTAGNGAGGGGAATGGGTSGGAAGKGGNASGGTGGSSSTPPPACDSTSTDWVGCPCNAGDSHACYPGTVNPATRNVGACKGGTQTCQPNGEFMQYGPCTGDTVPVAEACGNGVDDDCNGLTDCKDPSCADATACKSACTDGQTRPCYDGPAGTVNVGTCRPGTQTCAGGKWPTTCTGEVKPTKEVCTDTLDHNCNGFKGCNDLGCLINSYCWGACSNPDPGCVCPVGSGDAALCPKGDFGTVKSNNFGTGKPPDVECCPCTANDCATYACCANPACSGSSYCSGFQCEPLQASCNGQVSFDCDFEDYDPNDSSQIPEDCDQPCCECKPGC